MSGLNSTINQTWSFVEEINRSITNENRLIEESQERSAQPSKSGSRVARLQKVEQDVIVAKEGVPAKAPALQAPSSGQVIPLAAPAQPWNAFRNQDDHQTMGLIAIMAEVLSMQIRASSNFYSVLFQQSTEEMITNVKYVSITAEAVKKAYDNQSMATKTQSEITKTEGQAMFFAFFGTLAVSTGMEYFDPEVNVNKDKITFENDKPPEQLADNDGMKELNENAKEMTKDDQSVKGNVKKTGSTVLEKLKSVAKKGTKALMKGMMAAQAAGQGADATTKAWILPGKQNAVALYQKTEGEYQALSKESEGFGQFYSQSSNQSWQMVQGAEQNINSTVSILTQAGNTLGQASQRIFQ